MRLFTVLITCFAFILPASATVGIPRDGALGLQPAATRIMERLHWFHDYLLVIITLITLFVLGLLLYVIFRHNKRANPEPRQFSHNTFIEIIWTVVPALILVAIAGPSFSNLFYQDREPNLEKIVERAEEYRADSNEGALNALLKNHYPEAAAQGFVNVKFQGNQWNWTYTYPDTATEDEDAVEFISNPIHVGLSGEPNDANQPRNLAVDYPLVLPANRYIRYYTAAADVIHSWTVPAFGVKTDAIPGRLNQGWFLVEEPGIYYGQCSELCGINHAYMPIEVRVVPQTQYDAWLKTMKTGDWDAAAQQVATIQPLDASTQFASAE